MNGGLPSRLAERVRDIAESIVDTSTEEGRTLLRVADALDASYELATRSEMASLPDDAFAVRNRVCHLIGGEPLPTRPDPALVSYLPDDGAPHGLAWFVLVAVVIFAIVRIVTA